MVASVGASRDKRRARGVRTSNISCSDADTVRSLTIMRLPAEFSAPRSTHSQRAHSLLNSTSLRLLKTIEVGGCKWERRVVCSTDSGVSDRLPVRAWPACDQSRRGLMYERIAPDNVAQPDSSEAPPTVAAIPLAWAAEQGVSITRP
jgi:hypothetical protein